MFETEDMLPRAAPKPTLSLDQNEPAVKPIVPEVSILFNQGATATTCINNPTQQNKPPVQSYAAWRKQMLPKVTYPPGADSALCSSNAVVKSNVYPLRTYPAAASATCSNNDNGAYAYINRNETQVQQQRRSLESCVPVYSNAQITAVTASSNPNLVQMHQQEQHYMRRSLETLPVQRSLPPPPAMSQTPIIRPLPVTEVLTICAGTQTDSIGSPTQCNADVATKQDYQQLLGILQEMRLEQQRLTEMCALLMKQQQQRLQPTMIENKRASLKDASTQYEAVQATCQQRQAVLIKDFHTAEQYEVQQPSPNNCNQKCLPNAQQQQTQQNFQSPRVRPAAHSTGYRPNSPLINNIPQQQQNVVMSKPATDQSMVMNELALKYLPNDKLNEMLQEIHLSPTQQKVINNNYAATAATATPLRNIENIDKGPNDISNASYKYLKKYRLLPEEQQQQQQQRTSPLLQKQQKEQFQREQSPLAGHPRAMQEQHLLDLDAIRRQPKFL